MLFCVNSLSESHRLKIPISPSSGYLPNSHAKIGTPKSYDDAGRVYSKTACSKENKAKSFFLHNRTQQLDENKHQAQKSRSKKSSENAKSPTNTSENTQNSTVRNAPIRAL
jgi:hypothetical protein